MINLHAGQSEPYEALFIDKEHRYIVVRCARGWGKSYFGAVCAITAVYELMELPISVPHKIVYIIAPTYDQVTDIYYPLINDELGMRSVALKSSRDEGRFIFANGVELRLISYEAVERMRGKGSYFVVWDEVSSCKRGLHPKEAWQAVIQPTMVTRWSPKRAAFYNAPSAGRAVIISTPKGYNFFYELANREEKSDDWKSYHYDYKSSPFLDLDEIEKIKHEIDPIEFASEYMASFEDSGNSVFYNFKRKLHVRNDLEDFYPPEGNTPGETVHVCIDFNVGLQCSSMFAIRGGQYHWLDEMKGHTDTETLAIAIKTKYEGHKIIAFPDPTGKARKTSASVGRTDFSILESYGIRCVAREKSPPIVDSVQAVNRRLLTAAGDIGMYVHPRCEGLIKSLERTKWVDNNSDTATIDKKEGVEHFSDGVRYAVEYLSPVLSSKKRAVRGFSF
jgi:hypothetical protein